MDYSNLNTLVIDGIDLAKFYSYVMDRFLMMDYTIMWLEEDVCRLRAKGMATVYNAKYDEETRRCSITKPDGTSAYDGLEDKGPLYVNGVWNGGNY